MGRALQAYAPVEYALIETAVGVEPHPDFIEAISYASLNPFFRSVEFRKLLMSYREYGCRPPEALPKRTAKEIRESLEWRRQNLK